MLMDDIVAYLLQIPRTCDSFIADVDSTKTCAELEENYGVDCHGCACPDTALRCPRSVVNRTTGLRRNCDEMIGMHPSTHEDVQYAYVPTCAWLKENEEALLPDVREGVRRLQVCLESFH